MELLVVIAIISMLMAILVPVLSAAKSSGRKVVCLSNLRQICTAIHTYSMDHGGSIPVGPKAPPFTSPADFYPSTGAPTSLISLRSGKPVGLGLLLEDYLSAKPEVVFCPDADQPLSRDAELAKVGTGQAQGSYYYRHASVTRLFDDPLEPLPRNVPINNLGLNRDKRPVRALAIDTQFLCPPDLASFNMIPRTHHRARIVNIVYAEGHVLSVKNRDERFTVDLTQHSDIPKAFSKILAVFEQADRQH